MGDFIPRPDADALHWFQVFRKGIADDPSRYMIARSESDTIWSVVEEFAIAYRLSKAPETRNIGSTNRKVVTRQHAEWICRLYAGNIKRNHGIGNEDKLLIGVPVINNKKSKIECPMSSPGLTIVAATPNGHTLTYHDPLNPTRRAKPRGATMLQLFMVVSEKTITDVTQAKFVGNYTTNPIAVVHQPADRQKQATYFARWAGKRNQFGMWSLPVSMTIAA